MKQTNNWALHGDIFQTVRWGEKKLLFDSGHFHFDSDIRGKLVYSMFDKCDYKRHQMQIFHIESQYHS